MVRKAPVGAHGGERVNTYLGGSNQLAKRATLGCSMINRAIDYNVTGFVKRDLIAQIIIFLYRRFSATTPINNSRGQNFCVCLRGISHSLPTLTLSLRGWKYF